MTDKKRTERTEKHTSALDNEIKKALEWYVSKFKTVGFVYMDADGTHLIGTQDVLDLINRLQAENRAKDYFEKLVPKQKEIIDKQEAEIERLKIAQFQFISDINAYKEKLKTAKAEAYKEFVEKLLDAYEIWTDNDELEYKYVAELANNLLKKLTEKSN